MGVVIVEGKVAVLGVYLGRPIVTMGHLLRSCVKVHEPIELSFGVVSGVGSGIDQMGSTSCLKGKGMFLGFFSICAHIYLTGQNDVLFAENCIRLVCEN